MYKHCLKARSFKPLSFTDAATAIATLGHRVRGMKISDPVASGQGRDFFARSATRGNDPLTTSLDVVRRSAPASMIPRMYTTGYYVYTNIIFRMYEISQTSGGRLVEHRLGHHTFGRLPAGQEPIGRQRLSARGFERVLPTLRQT